MTTSRTLAVSALILTTALTGTSCASSAGSGTESPSAPSGSATASESPTSPSVPSDWQEVSVDPAQLHVPPDWTVEPGGAETVSMVAPEDDLGYSPGFGNLLASNLGGGGDMASNVETIAGYEKDRLTTAGAANLKRLPDVTINGALFYHFQYEKDRTWNDSYATVTEDGQQQITVNWDFNKSDIDRKGADALITKVLPTFELL
ncbi:hypothetical protein OH802_03630 [Nocardioides sp. NBC_00850]|uniref:hypothetical protein n=1 Tax=Nocardioides sp. NBC_00850 TaxID=2976001 RepID=UPI0038638718|nr:hypothetical protein OH802_03630 [Nocardioides sp. NBC_00850]